MSSSGVHDEDKKSVAHSDFDDSASMGSEPPPIKSLRSPPGGFQSPTSVSSSVVPPKTPRTPRSSSYVPRLGLQPLIQVVDVTFDRTTVAFWEDYKEIFEEASPDHTTRYSSLNVCGVCV